MQTHPSLLNTPPIVDGPAPAAKAPRWQGLDTMKGIFMVLVVFGHTMAPQPPYDMVKWWVYAVHMPAFLFLAGYMLSAPKFFAKSFGDHAKTYAQRLLLPWLIVSLLYKVVFSDLPFARRFSPREMANLVFSPDFHLWFVPVLVALIAFTWVLARKKSVVTALLIGFAVLAVVAPSINWNNLPLQKVIYLLGDKRFYTYGFFFLLGFGLRNEDSLITGLTKLSVKAFPWLQGALVALLTVAFFGINERLNADLSVPFGGQLFSLSALVQSLGIPAEGKFFSPGLIPDDLIFFLLNVVLLPVLVVKYRDSQFPSAAGRWLTWVGANSLYFYLLHPFAIIPIREWMVDRNFRTNLGFAGCGIEYIISIVAAGLFCLIPYLVVQARQKSSVNAV